LPASERAERSILQSTQNPVTDRPDGRPTLIHIEQPMLHLLARLQIFPAHNLNTRPSDSCLKPRLSFHTELVSGSVMRKIVRSLALRTRSDERALWFAILVLALSVFAAALFQNVVS
jgi:hypothetical protein